MMVQNWYAGTNGALQAFTYKGWVQGKSNPSWGRLKSGGRVGRFVRTWESESARRMGRSLSGMALGCWGGKAYAAHLRLTIPYGNFPRFSRLAPQITRS